MSASQAISQALASEGKTNLNLNEIEKGDVFSEIVHYTYQGEKDGQLLMQHHATGAIVSLSKAYVKDLLKTANQYDKTVKVTKEDTFWTESKIKKAGKNAPDGVREGDLEQKGIRTIWEEIHSQQVFTVCFLKQDKSKTKKAFSEEKNQLIQDLVAKIEKARNSKKSVVDAASEAIEHALDNPILDFIPGEERILTGYKLQFVSRDGKYQCMDMDINEPRLVNINTIKWLVYNGVRYELG